MRLPTLQPCITFFFFLLFYLLGMSFELVDRHDTFSFREASSSSRCVWGKWGTLQRWHNFFFFLYAWWKASSAKLFLLTYTHALVFLALLYFTIVSSCTSANFFFLLFSGRSRKMVNKFLNTENSRFYSSAKRVHKLFIPFDESNKSMISKKTTNKLWCFLISVLLYKCLYIFFFYTTAKVPYFSCRSLFFSLA